MPEERYVSFGEQVGAVSSLALGPQEVSNDFRNAVWNLVSPYFTEASSPPYRPDIPADDFLRRMARDKRWVVDDLRFQYYYQSVAHLKTWLLTDAKWHEVYDFLQSFPRWGERANQAKWEQVVDRFLFEERSPYRFAGHRLALITSKEERDSVTAAVGHTGKYAPASEHMAKAVTKFSQRPTPDYENAAKEAASAVESALKIATGKEDVGAAAPAFAKTYGVHGALGKSASNLFGYASDREGVRHAKTQPGNAVEFAEALLVIVSASAWVNFIIAKAP